MKSESLWKYFSLEMFYGPCNIRMTCIHWSVHRSVRACMYPLVRPVRKKWLSPFSNTLCPWPTFHASMTTVWKKWLSLYYSTIGATFTKFTPNVHRGHHLLMHRAGLCPWQTSQASMTKAQNCNSGAPVIPITIFCFVLFVCALWPWFFRHLLWLIYIIANQWIIHNEVSFKAN